MEEHMPFGVEYPQNNIKMTVNCPHCAFKITYSPKDMDEEGYIHCPTCTRPINISYRYHTAREAFSPGPSEVEHPSHYTFGKYEVLDVIEDWNMPYHLGNVMKYIARAGRKDPDKEIEDLKKAMTYLKRYIDMKEKK